MAGCGSFERSPAKALNLLDFEIPNLLQIWEKTSHSPSSSSAHQWQLTYNLLLTHGKAEERKSYLCIANHGRYRSRSGVCLHLNSLFPLFLFLSETKFDWKTLYYISVIYQYWFIFCNSQISYSHWPVVNIARLPLTAFDLWLLYYPALYFLCLLCTLRAALSQDDIWGDGKLPLGKEGGYFRRDNANKCQTKCGTAETARKWVNSPGSCSAELFAQMQKGICVL